MESHQKRKVESSVPIPVMIPAAVTSSVLSFLTLHEHCMASRVCVFMKLASRQKSSSPHHINLEIDQIDSMKTRPWLSPLSVTILRSQMFPATMTLSDARVAISIDTSNLQDFLRSSPTLQSLCVLGSPDPHPFLDYAGLASLTHLDLGDMSLSQDEATTLPLSLVSLAFNPCRIINALSVSPVLSQLISLNAHGQQSYGGLATLMLGAGTTLSTLSFHVFPREFHGVTSLEYLNGLPPSLTSLTLVGEPSVPIAAVSEVIDRVCMQPKPLLLTHLDLDHLVVMRIPIYGTTNMGIGAWPIGMYARHKRIIAESYPLCDVTMYHPPRPWGTMNEGDVP